MRGEVMKRRDFITLLGGAAVAWPLAGRAQTGGKLPTIGLLAPAAPAAHGPWFAALVQRLNELGWIEGRTVAIEQRYAEGRSDRYDEIAAEFVRLKADVIVTTGPAAQQARRATSVIPIVLPLSGDPVGVGLAASLARPGGNVTGLSIIAARTCQQAARTFARGRPQYSWVGDHGQSRISRCRAGGERGSGVGSTARHRSHHAQDRASGGCHAHS
jgi:ABC transporter substrate binding protein